MKMTPEQFIKKWSSSRLKERSGSQEHFIDVCGLVGHPTPAEMDSTGETFTFERGTRIHGAGDGFADVWYRDHFAWEYKGKHQDLKKAYDKLLLYRASLGNPPLLIVSDMRVIEVHTNFTNTAEEVHYINLEDLRDYRIRQKLEWILRDPERLKPGTTREEITAKAAHHFAGLASSLRTRGHNPHDVAHFLSKIVFCLFAQDVELLPKGTFSQILEAASSSIKTFNAMLKNLLITMNTGGTFGATLIPYFDGGLFNDDIAIPLERQDTEVIAAVARLNWSNVEPSIFGTLFERGMDPEKSGLVGAHYTPRSDIERVIDSVIMEPLLHRWGVAKNGALAMLAKIKPTKGVRKNIMTAGEREEYSRYRHRAEKIVRTFLDDDLCKVKVLDPACGSGAFLYVALERLHDLEKEALLLLQETWKEQKRLDVAVGPHQVMGIEINSYAAELAQVTVWIGHLQWFIRNGFGFRDDPVLQKLELIQNRDALIGEDGKPTPWPDADYIVGNPPFLGNKKMISGIGENYTFKLRNAYKGKLPAGVDLVAYWFERAREQIAKGRTHRVGLVATNRIRGVVNREVLVRIKQTGHIFEAWSDEPWTVEGAAVRISIVCFSGRDETAARLNGAPVSEIHADLTADINLTAAKLLVANSGVSFMGIIKGGPFGVSGEIARLWLRRPLNPNKRGNLDVVRPWMNGLDVTKRRSDTWIVDFGTRMSEHESALYEAPFEHVRAHVKPLREAQRRTSYANYWWRHMEPRPAMREALDGLARYIATPLVAKHRVFVWVDSRILVDARLIVIARDDDTTFGILHSRFHKFWSLRLGSTHESRPVYTHTSAFETFPFPEGLSPDIPPTRFKTDLRAQEIAEAARHLNDWRENWLNPPDLVKRVPEVVKGLPDRLVPIDAEAASELKNRTLTKLYNKPPGWLIDAHNKLDNAVARAYGWNADISEQEILRKLLALNRKRAKAQTMDG